MTRWALEHHRGIVEKTAEPVPYDAELARQVAGRYETDAMRLDIATDGTHLTMSAMIKPKLRAASDEEMPPDYPAMGLGFLPGATGEYILTDGGLQGQRGYFSRDREGTITGVDLAGRLFTRVPDTSRLGSR